jgi:hypothetical protein
MTTKTVRHFLWSCLILLKLAFFLGCATSPNIPFAGRPYPSTLEELDQKNLLLVQELGKLPEIQDGISPEEERALKDLLDLYLEDQKAFDKTFNQMYVVGKPEVRKYCSPLQALYWLSEDGKMDDLQSLIHNYSLKNLLDSSWNFNKRIKLKILNLSEQLAQEIVDVLDKDVIFLAKYQETAKETIKYCYNRNPNDIPWEYRELIENGNNFKIAKVKFERNNLRWKDFNTVVDRLNAPELLDYYINQNIVYFKNRTNSHRPKHTFSHHWGDCDDLAVFGQYILRKGGYRASPRYVHWTADNRGHVGVVIKLEGGRYFLAIDFGRNKNKMTGPYTKISEVDKKLSCGYVFHDSGWWTPPR